MRWSLVFLILPLLTSCVVADEEPPPGISSWTIDTTTVAAGAEVESSFELEHFELAGEEGDHEHSDGDGSEADDHHGQVHIYLDDLETNPLEMQTAHHATITIPAETAVGTHTLLARLHNASHEIIEPQVVVTTDIEVTAR